MSSFYDFIDWNSGGPGIITLTIDIRPEHTEEAERLDVGHGPLYAQIIFDYFERRAKRKRKEK